MAPRKGEELALGQESGRLPSDLIKDTMPKTKAIKPTKEIKEKKTETPKDLIVISPSEITQFASEGGKLVFRKEAEESLVKLINLQRLIEEKIDGAKKAIEDAGNAVGPGFKGVIGEKVRATYRVYGEIFGYKLEKLEELKAAGFINEKIFYKINSPKTQEYLDNVGELPDGAVFKDRQPTLSITLLEDKMLPKATEE